MENEEKDEFNLLVGERLKEFSKKKGFNVTNFEISLGIGVGSISKTVSIGKAIGAKVLKKIIFKYPDLNVDWLFTGRGEMLWGAKTIETIQSDKREEVLVDKLIEVANVKNELSGQIEDLRRHLETKDELVAMQKDKIKSLELQIEQQRKSIKQPQPATP